MITLPLLKTLVAVAETGAIKEAAARLGRTPSAVSMALNQLEKELGARLFEGERKRRLTEVGRFAAAEAEELLRHYSRSTAAITEFASSKTGRLAVTCVPSVAMALLPEVLLRFRKTSPGVIVNLRDMDSRGVTNAVDCGEADIGIASRVKDLPSLRFEPLFSERLGVICHHGDAISKVRTPLPWKALSGRTLLANDICREVKDPAFQAILAAAPMVVLNVASALALVRKGMGVTILSRLAISSGQKGLRFLPLADPQAARRAYLITPAERSLSPAAEALASIIRHFVRQEAAAFGLEAEC